MKNIIIGAVVVSLIAIGVWFVFGPEEVLGGPGCNGGNCTDYDAVNVIVGYYIGDSLISSSATSTQSGLVTLKPTSVSTTTTGTSATMSQSDLFAGQYVTVNINQNATFTWTLPASTTLGTLLPSAGNMGRWCYENATGTAGVDLIFVAGTGIDLEMATGTSALEIVGPRDSACLSLQRKVNTDVTARLEIFDDTD